MYDTPLFGPMLCMPDLMSIFWSEKQTCSISSAGPHLSPPAFRLMPSGMPPLVLTPLLQSLALLVPSMCYIQPSSECLLHHTALLNSPELLDDFISSSHFIGVLDIYVHISFTKFWVDLGPNLTLYLSYYLHLTSEEGKTIKG